MRKTYFPRLAIILVALLSILNAAIASDFPYSDLIPKSETGAERFLSKHPEYDGRGVVVAIFDTGVDPGAAGLQTTSDGRPKIVDMVDASGSGDVKTSKKVTAKDGVIEGLTGRMLKTGKDWNNPTGDFYIGMKPAYELFPAKLVSRVKADRKKKWDKKQRVLTMEVRQKFDSFDQQHPKPNKGQKKEREELDARVKQLAALQKSYNDPGPVFDCVVFHDGMVWRAVVDTDEDGDLDDEKLMTNYRLEGQWSTFGEFDLLNFAVNIYEDGKLLSIVADCGAHGTHVASIVAAHVPDQPELNGVAPGAQIVAVKIGDTRMGSSSMGTGSVRGLIAVRDNNCDLINMSYGGATAVPNSGRVVDLYSEIVDKHGVIFVASAGNNGPALSTVGSPGGTTSAIFGIGAYVSPGMMSAQYSLLKELSENNYTWSSRGPTFDGDLGVDFCAPGGAVASVSNWTLQRNMLMNGTSMSSPNACGGIALLLSGLKSEGIAYTPQRVKRAVGNTCRVLEDVEVFAQGRGLIQIDRAYDYLVENKHHKDDDLRFEVSVSDRDGARGIYLRENYEHTAIVRRKAKVEAKFHEDASSKAKVDFEMHFELECSQAWVKAPSHLALMYGGRSFDVEVHTEGLAPGAHYAEVKGVIAGEEERGVVFRLPVTVVVDEKRDSDLVFKKEFQLDTGELARHFVHVPEGAQWVDMWVRAKGFENPRRVVLHSLQSVPGVSFRSSESRSYITLAGGQEKLVSTKVAGGRMMELVLGQYWSTDGLAEYELELHFRGLTPGNEVFAANGNESTAKLNVQSELRDEKFLPSVSFKTVRRSIKPTGQEIRSLDKDRDMLSDQRLILEAVNTYKISFDSKKKVKPRFDLNDEWESKLWALYDANKKLIAYGGSGKSVSLKKGSYTLQLHVRHVSRSRLEQLKQLPMLLDMELEKSISLSAHATETDALLGNRKLTSRNLRKGEQTVVFFNLPERKSYAKWAQEGDVLVGSMKLCASDSGLLGAEARPGGWRALMTVPVDDGKTSSVSASSEEKDEKTDEEKLAESIRDLKIGQLNKWSSSKHDKRFAKLYAELRKEWPKHMPLHLAGLKRLDTDALRKKHLGKIISGVDSLIGMIDRDALKEGLVLRVPEGDEKGAKQRKELEKERDTLADLLYRKGRAIAYAETMIAETKKSSDEKSNEESAKSKKSRRDKKKQAESTKEDTKTKPPTLKENAFEDNYEELQRWVDVSDSKYVLLKIRNERRAGRYGKALELLEKHMGTSKPSRKLYDKRIKILESLGWNDWANLEKQWNLLRFRPHFLPF